MSKVIWKFGLASQPGHQSIEMPDGARILSFGLQGEYHRVLTVWALCDPDAETVSKDLFLAWTGSFPPPEENFEYFIGTVQDGVLVWHLFGRTRPDATT